MRWKQKKPLWPTLLALSCLFVLAISATRSWQRATTSVASRQVASTPDLVCEEQEGMEFILLPPPPHRPEVAAKPSIDATFTESETEDSDPTLDTSVALLDPLPESEFNIDTLLQMRDLLLSVVDQLEEKLPTPQTMVSQHPHQVRVSSPHDRLAMVNTHRRKPRIQLQPRVESTESTLQDFANELLNPSEHPKTLTIKEPKRDVVREEPRIASLPSRPTPTPVITEVQPEVKLPLPVVQQDPTPTDSEPEKYETLSPMPLQVPEVAMRNNKPRPLKKEPVVKPTPQVAAVPAALRTRPKHLMEQLQTIAEKPSPHNEWAASARTLVEELADNTKTTPIDTELIIEQLSELAETGISVSNPILQPLELATAHSLQRRLGVWKVLLVDTPSTSFEYDQSSAYADAIVPLLREISLLLNDQPNGEDWHEYLQLENLAAATSASTSEDSSHRSELVQKVLSRMESPRLTEQQREFLAEEPLAKLHKELQPWAVGPVNLELLDALMERYEKGRETRYAVAIAKLTRRLQWSRDTRLQELAEHLDEHYRGANMRIAVTDDLMNRMIPKQKDIVSPVRERIAGSKVRGHSRTTSEARVRLLPGVDSWRFSLEAFGKVYSETHSETWPARVQNAARMQFEARKMIVVSDEGLRVSPARAKAEGRNHLKGVESELDPVPFIGYLLRDLARQKHHKSRGIALNQVKSKVARQARQRMDKATNPKLVNLEHKFREHVLVPLSKLALLAEPVDMFTTSERAVMKVRLANNEQLAAHTQRPFAPSDSLASMQMHETALNNAIARLGLDGQKMSVPELYQYFAEKFGREDATPPADLPARASIQFADRDAIRVNCDGDRFELILTVKQLGHGRDKIKNFEAHAFFRPVVNGLEVKLVRDGTLQFNGRRLKTGPRVVLHSVLGKLLRKDQEITLIRSTLQSDPRLAGIMVTQLEVDNGWIALALGPAHPQRTAWRSSEQRIPAPALVR